MNRNCSLGLLAALAMLAAPASFAHGDASDAPKAHAYTEPGEVRFACLLPGHFEAGMAGKVMVE